VTQFVVLKVITTGEDLEDRFNTTEPLTVVFNRALQAVGGSANRDQFTLEYQDQPLGLDRKIEEYVEQFGWEDGTVLELVPRPEVI
jgi:hypothetical protein